LQAVRQQADEKLFVAKMTILFDNQHKLDAYQAEITALLKNGATKTWIARKNGTTHRNLCH